MPAKTSQDESTGFSAEERAAMKARAAELRAEGKKGAKKADELQAALDSMAKMTPEDRAIAERVHATITENAPELSAKTWYGMPAYANPAGKTVVSESGFSTRDQLDELERVGVDAVLIGETLMRAEDIETAVRELTLGGLA